ncbi:hypothetical protein NX722_17010 [Endozoicomonas gorgoniicola]|uniref:Uncharacterized protein n=1 Tax=Endozoicomonas gorgoniicola TaxID=1234144 RepID=A0ABT3MY52_9GAMM|nr:hypothetical protein [Endozoicomonas gorgoniicola]MCW7554287.1 hypothetical protein [Endozoicomonas gorgoniicola]
MWGKNKAPDIIGQWHSGNVYYNIIEMFKGSQVNGSLEPHPNGKADIKPLIAKATAGTVVEHG